VVQPAGSGLGGGGFAVLLEAGGSEAHVVDFREVAPAAASRDMYLGPDGLVDPDASREGGLAVAVPAESRGLALLVSAYGRLSHREVAAPAVRLAREGFSAGAHLVEAIARTSSEQVKAEFDQATHGDIVARPELAKTLKRWAATAGEDLHAGASAGLLVRHVQASGGVITLEDLAGWQAQERAPIEITYRGHRVITMPPPSSGGVALAQILQVLEAHDLGSYDHNSAVYLHLLVETMKHAFADRAHHLGDPEFVDVPVQRLLSSERVEEVRAAFDPSRSFPPEHYGPLIAPPVDAGTQHISVIDAEGAAVALTTTINTSFGSGLVVPGVGVVLNNQMDDFAAAPGVPNAFGLIGGEANAIAPGKRPLSSMSPTLVLDADGRVVLAVGASGGSTIISAVLQVIVNVVDFGMDPQEAVTAARVHHQWQPDVLFVEPEISADTRAVLEALGHTLKVARAFSSTQIVTIGEDGLRQGGADPRKGGRPAGAF
jgi:gamma-glutamyltranspeptidase/glutathione hydrolase